MADTPVNGPPAGTTTTSGPNGPVTSQDAIAILSQELTSWGFGSDAIQWATNQIQSNASIDQILYSLRQQPFYQNSIFGQVAAAREKAGLAAMTEGQILSYQDYAEGLANQAGLPKGFLSQSEIVQLLGQDVSTSELDQRITQGYTTAIKAPPDVLAQLQTYYGVTPGSLAAYYLNPQKALPILQQQFASAQIGAEATRTGFGILDKSTAMGLAQLGKTQSEYETGFTDLARQAQLFAALPGSGEQGIGEQIQLAAEFGGNAEDQKVIQQRAEERKATFEGGYRFAESATRGITGLGSRPTGGA